MAFLLIPEIADSFLLQCHVFCLEHTLLKPSLTSVLLGCHISEVLLSITRHSAPPVRPVSLCCSSASSLLDPMPDPQQVPRRFFL
jgi:hypothetical protein